MIELTPEDLRPARARQLEWVEPDGLGGFAMGNACLWPTRRYHGLLTVARRPPTDRRVLVAGLEEQVETEHDIFRLDTSERAGGEGPRGVEYQVGMALDPFPRFAYEVGSHRLERTVAVPRGHPAVVIRYRHLRGPSPLGFLVSPLLAGRSFHDLVQANSLADQELRRQGEDLCFRPYPEEPAVYLRTSGARYHHAPEWIHGLHYDQERTRGYPYREDLLRPGHLEFELAPGETFDLLLTSEPLGDMDAASLLEAEAERRSKLAGREGSPSRRLLALAADRFRARRGEDGRTILAGFPWFEDWGRDTFISLAGITGVAASATEESLRVLETYAPRTQAGLVVNRFGDRPGDASHAAADASLWFVHEFGRLRERAPDLDLDTVWPTVREVFERYRAGTRHGIRVDPADGLLRASEPGLQLTWMDAMVDDTVVTPRSGKPIELQGLWYACCRVVALEARRRQETTLEEAANAAADAVRASFHDTYWLEALSYYGDCVGEDGTLDSSLRPNQLIPMSLRFRPVDTAAGRRALEAIEARLLTPFGLRTLAPDHPEYRGHYGGDVAARDFAYHQGTAWPWLLGPYGRACLQLRGRSDRARLRELLQPLLDWMNRDGMGNLPEVFDGDEPHAPGGCPAQAWSVAEVRALLSELDHEPDGYDPVEV